MSHQVASLSSSDTEQRVLRTHTFQDQRVGTQDRRRQERERDAQNTKHMHVCGISSSHLLSPAYHDSIEKKNTEGETRVVKLQAGKHISHLKWHRGVATTLLCSLCRAASYQHEDEDMESEKEDETRRGTRWKLETCSNIEVRPSVMTMR